MECRMSRRSFLLRAAMATTGLAGGALLSACAPTPAPTPTVPAQKELPTEKPKEAPKKAPGEVVTITMAIQAGWITAVPGMYSRRPLLFMQENPDIKIQMVEIPGGEYDAKLLTMAAANTIPDTMHTSDVWTFHSRLVRSGILRNVDDLLDASGISKQEWLPAAISTLTYEGKMYGLPKTCHPGDAYIWINDDLFAADGLTPPDTYGATFQNISEWAEKLSKGPQNDRQVYGYFAVVGGIQAIVNGVRQFGTYENNEAGTESLADNEQWRQWAQWLKPFYDKKLASLEGALPSGGAPALFLAGKLAMCHSQRFMYRRVNVGIKSVPKPFQWRVIQYPRGPQAKGWGASVDTHSASAICKHPQEAFRVLYGMADKKFALFVAEDQGYLTARVDDLDTVKPIIYPFLELQYKCMTQEEKFRQPANARGTEVETAYKSELDLV